MANYENDQPDRIITGSNSSDYISNSGTNVTINALGGNDSVRNEGDSAVIDMGTGNDSIENFSSYASINGGEGRDYLGNNYYSERTNVTMLGGEGDDTINGEGAPNSLLDGGAGNDSIGNGGENVTINGGAGNDSIDNNGNAAIIDAGAGNDFIGNGYASDSSILGGDGKDTISFDGYEGNNNFADGGAGDDYIYSENEDVINQMMIGGAGNDTLVNYGINGTLVGGAGNDSIVNQGANAEIDGGDGNDIIDLNDNSENSYINAGAGNDTISTGSYVGGGVIIEAGTGDDFIHNYDPDDNLVYKYSVGDGNDTIEGYNRYNPNGLISIVGGEYSTVRSGNDIIVNVGDGSLTLLDAAGVDLNIEGDLIEGDADADDDTADDTTDDTADDTTDDTADDTTDDTADDTTDDTTDDTADDTTDDTADDTTDDTADDTTDDTADDTTDDTDADSDLEIIDEPYWKLEGKKASYYPAPSEGDEPIVTVDGVKAIGGLAININRKVVTVATSSLDESTVTINNGYRLALANSVSAPSMEPEYEWDFRGTVATCNVSASKPGYMIESNQIKYVPEGTSSTIVLDGVSDYEGIKINGTTVTLSKEALNGSTAVSVNDGYTLALANDVDKPLTMSGKLNYNGTAAIYTSSGTYAGYKIEDNQAIYVPNKDSEHVEITGVTSANGITRVDGEDTFIIPASVLNKAKVTISEGYELALADDVAQPHTVKAGWNLEGTTATYSRSATQAGYSLSEDKESINYTSAVTGDSLVAVEGVANTKGLYIDSDDKSVTVYKEALNKQDITISDGYSLKLSEQVDGPKGETGWILEGTLAKYQSGQTSEGYILDEQENTIVYKAASEGEIKAELDGMNDIPTFNEAYDTVQLTEENFTDEGVSIKSNAGGYGFEVKEGSYSHGAFMGSAEKDSITNGGNYINVNGGAGNDRIVNNAGNVSIDGGANNDKIINNAANVEIFGGAGNDNVTVSGGGEAGNIFSYSKGNGKDILYSFAETDSIRIADNSAVEASIDGNNILFKVGSGSITINDGAKTRREVLFVDSTGNEIDSLSGNEYTKEGIITYEDGNANIVLTSTFRGSYKAENIDRIDGSKTKKGIAIEGIVLVGGKGKDSLTNSEDNFELTGGKGNDVFIYNGGKGVIKDYSQKGSNGKDKIELGSLSVAEYDIQAQNVILGFSESDSLTIEGGVGKEISFGAKKSTISTYTADGVYDEKQKAVTLAKDKTEFSAAKMSKLVTIDGSAADYEISITGNKKANIITAGANGSTLSGGKGKDTLIGGAGTDVFVYENKSGNKVISNYDFEVDTGDKISFGEDATLDEVTKKGNNLVLKSGKNKLTIEGGNGQIFTFIENGEEKTYDNGLLMNADKKSVTVTSAAEKAIDFSNKIYENIQNVNAEALKKALIITGNSSDNELVGGKGKDSLIGSDGSDVLRGGKGNDTLWGGLPTETFNDADTFVFWAGDGNDLIMDYNFEEGDMLRILDKNGKKDAAFTSAFDEDGTLTLKVKGGGKITFDNISDQTQFNINNTTYHREGTTLVK